jgi:uncharacterized RDD family membrane protein YckC
MAHTAVFRLAAASTAPVYVVLSIVAQVLVVASIVTMAADSRHRSLHDLITGTRVVPAEQIIGSVDSRGRYGLSGYPIGRP